MLAVSSDAIKTPKFLSESQPAPSARVLVAREGANGGDSLQRILAAAGFEVDVTENEADAVRMMRQTAYDVVLAGAATPGPRGWDAARHASSLPNAPAVIVIAGPGAGEAALSAIRSGAYDAIMTPYRAEEIQWAVGRAADHRRLRIENERLRRGLGRPDAMAGLIGHTTAMINLRQMILTAAKGDLPVLILGEIGTGKKLVARAIHELSARAEGPFVDVHCGGFPEAALEGEIFGVAAKAGGARAEKPGHMRAASGGTLFLEEIGGMSAAFHGKLLRAAANRMRPVGSERPAAINVRLIASTNQNIQRYFHNGVFRRETFGRLGILPIMTPPLRERREDIPLLLAHFAGRIAKRHGRAPNEFTPGALGRLGERSWPGNVRELENLAERLSAIYPGRRIDSDLIDAQFRNEGRRSGARPRVEIPDYGVDFNDLIDQHERDLIDEALRRAGGVKNRAAVLLRLKRTTLVEKMRKKGMLD